MANYIQEGKDKFSYICSCEVDMPFRMKIGTLEGHREKKSFKAVLDDPLLQFSGLYQSDFSDLYVVAQMFASGKPLTLPVQTAYKAFSTRWNWNEWITLPIHYKDIPRSAIVALTVYDIYGPQKTVPVGGTTTPVFGKHGCLRRGIRDLKVWSGVEADGSQATSTPGDADDNTPSEMTRLSKLVRKHRKGRMMTVDWLDRLTFREIEVINEQEKRISNCMFLTIELPKFHLDSLEHAVVWFEPDGELPEPILPTSEFQVVQDPEWNLDNLVELKHHRLTHSLRKGLIAKELKPNAKLRDSITQIVNFPPTHQLTNDEKLLLWQFRYYLMQEKKALPKFLLTVRWQSRQEAEEALDLLYQWQPLDPGDALELLTPTYLEPKVRKYAISRLQCAENEELLLYLLQLVQALRYEVPEFLSFKPPHEDPPALSIEGTYSEATKFRLERELAEAVLEEGEEAGKEGTLSPLSDDNVDSESDSECGDELFRRGGPPPSSSQQQQQTNSMEASMWSLDMSATTSSLNTSVYETEYPDLSSFLIARACRSTQLASYFYWYLTVECNEDKDKIKYEQIRLKFLDDLKNSSKVKWRKRHNMLIQQELLVAELMGIMSSVASLKEDRIKRMDRLRSCLAARPSLLNFRQPIRLPLDPSCHVVGILAEEASLFKSALCPAKLGFKTTDNKIYWVMFKVGDDLRQDQLILQLITLMDRLLRRENLDLKLTPYNVLACSGKHGFVQLVDRTDAVAHVLATYKNIQTFFRQCAPRENAPYGINPEVMDTYVKSCAGYCVITYLLGVGDRHLDNLLLSDAGHLIHVDFGYILGRDPKLFPPPMKLNKEMVEAMGGTGSPEYQKFREHCYNAFLILRRSANIILSLFSLMLDTGVPDIALEPDKTVQKVKDKFCLDFNEEEAVKHVQSLIDESVTAVMAVFVERMHKWAQYWRK